MATKMTRKNLDKILRRSPSKAKIYNYLSEDPGATERDIAIALNRWTPRQGHRPGHRDAGFAKTLRQALKLGIVYRDPSIKGPFKWFAAKPIDAKMVDVSRSKSPRVARYYTSGEFVYIDGLKTQILGADTGRYYLNCSGNNTMIFTRLGIDNPKSFIERIVGYEPGSGDFPTVASLDDLNKVIYALLGYKKSASEKRTYKAGDSVTIHNLNYVVADRSSSMPTYGRFYLNLEYGNNDKIFTDLGISDPHKFVSDVVGYRCSAGIFPEVSSLEDLNKVIDALLECKDPDTKIVGYKILDPKLTKAACCIDGYVNFGESIRHGDLVPVTGISKLEKAEVLDLWFEPVYEKTYKEYTTTNTSEAFEPVHVRIYKDRIQYGDYDVSRKDLILIYNLLTEDMLIQVDDMPKKQYSIHGYPVQVNQVKIGCQIVDKDTVLNIKEIQDSLQ